MKIRRLQFFFRIVLFLFLLAELPLAAQRTPLTVSVIPQPPFTNQVVHYLNNPVNKFRVVIQNQTNKTYNYYLQFKLEQLAPGNKSIQTPAVMPPPLPLIIGPHQMYGPLSQSDIDQNFGHLRFEDYIMDGFDINDLIMNGGILDEGMYQICIFLYDYDNQTGNPVRLNNLNSACATFYLCQNATAPVLVNPAVCNNSVSDTLPPSNPLLFSWNQPVMTCGSSTNSYEYNIRFVEIMDGQNATSALDNNPRILEFSNYSAPTLLVDTNIFMGVFTPGKRYAWDVQALVASGGSPMVFANQGLSQMCTFVYGFTPAPPVVAADTTTAPEKTKPDIVNDTSASSIAGCNAPLPQNTTYFSSSLTGKRVTIGYFTMTIESATEVPGSGYTGLGYVNWKPYTNDTIKIAVEFSGLKINSSYQVFEGVAHARFDSDMGMYVPESIRKAKTWAEMANGYAVYVGAGDYQANINQYFNKIGEYNRRLLNLKGSAPYMLPFTIGDMAANNYADIGIIGMSFTPTTAKMNLLAAANIPEANNFLAFVGHGFCFLPENAGNFGEGTLYLGEDFQMPLPDGYRWDFKAARTLGDTTTGGTFIRWDSDGFNQARIECDLVFPTSVLLKENASGTILTGQNVKATFAAHFREWGNWIAMATMDPFQLPDLPGYSFNPSGIWYDNSGTVNPDNLVFLSGYNGLKTNAWKGLYIHELSTTLPANFKTFNNSGTRTSFVAGNIIIDNHGFTGDISGLRLIDLSTGNLGGWNFSMDTIRVEVRNSSMQSAWLNGKILLPISDTALVYRMEMHYAQGVLNYTASLHPKDTMNMSLWLAKMHLDPSSGFDFEYAGDFPKFDFTLNGGISIEIINTESIDLSLKGITFQGLTMSNHKNGASGFTMDIGTWAWSSPEKTLGPFPIDFTVPEIIFDETQQLYGLRFGGSFDLAEKAFVCTTRVDVLGAVSMSMTSGPKAQFRKVQLYDITVSGNFDPVSIEGRLQFYQDDPVYGDGVKGRVVASFPIVRVDATAQFGNIPKSSTNSKAYSYWFVDAGVKFDPPFEAFPFGIGGFCGGVWYNMQMNYEGDLTAGQVYSDTTRLSMVAIDPGATVSGITYTPSRGKGGVKAGITLTISNSLGGGNIINGDVILSCQWNNNRFSAISLEGRVWGITNYPQNTTSLFNAQMLMVYDHDSSTFFFSLNAKAVFLSSVEVTIPVEFWTKTDENLWYFKIGDPSDPNKMAKATLFEGDYAIVSGYLRATAYFALGNALQDVNLPEIPAKIQEFLDVNLDKYRIDPSSFSSKNRSGMLFGAQLAGGLDIDLLIIYASFEAIAGFDVALFHDKDLLCEGNSAGYNGWYGLGQIYAWFKGDVGVKIDVWFFEGKVSLGSIEAGALLMGGMPNPFWTFGSVRIRGSVLGGLIKISTSVSVEVGEPCYPGDLANPLANIKVLEEINPGYETIVEAKENEPVSVFINPRATSNIKLSSNAVIHDIPIMIPPSPSNPDTNIRYYKFFVKDVKLYEGNATTVAQNAPSVEVSYALADENASIVNITRTARLKPNTYYRIEVKASAKSFEDGEWKDPLVKNERKEHIETLTRYFRTGPLPNNIPKENLVFSMPLNRQRNYYRKEYNQGGVILQDEQNYLFNDPANRVELWLRSMDGQYSQKLAFTNSGRAIYYSIPQDIPTNKLYNLALIRINLEGEQNFLNALARENRKKVIISLLDKKVATVLQYGTQTGQITLPGTPSLQNASTLQQANPGLATGVMNQAQTSGTQTIQTQNKELSSTTLQQAQMSTLAGEAGSKFAGNKVAGNKVITPGKTFDQEALDYWEELQAGYNSTYKNDTMDYRQMESVNQSTFGFIDTMINLYFRTSLFDRIADKFAAAGNFKPANPNNFTSNPSTNLLIYSVNPVEMLEKIEVIAYSYTYSNPSENMYGFFIPPLLYPDEGFNAQLNDHEVWKGVVFDMLHWVYDECERGQFKIKESTVTSPQVLSAQMGFLRMEGNIGYLMEPGARFMSEWWPINYRNPLSFSQVGLAPGIKDTEIAAKRILASYSGRIGYNAEVIRQTLDFDYRHAHEFLEDYNRKAADFSSGGASSRNNKARDCIAENWMIQSYSNGYSTLGVADMISLPYYQMVQFWEDKKSAVHEKLAGHVYANPFPDYVNIVMPPLNYTSRSVTVRKLNISAPEGTTAYSILYNNNTAVITIQYTP